MYKKSFLIFMAAAGIVAYLGFRSVGNTEPLPPRQTGEESLTQVLSATRTNTEGAVTVAVTPKDMRQGVFEVLLDTHSVELGDDLMQSALIKDQTGAEYRALAWEGAPPGGHHRAGLLKFGPLPATVEQVELIMRGVGGVPERKFVWSVSP